MADSVQTSGRTRALVYAGLLALLFGASLWSDRREAELEGPGRIVKGERDTLYVLTEDQIIRASSQGEALSVMSLADLGISERVAELFVEPNGELLIGLQTSQEIRRYTPDGKMLGVHSRPPSPPAKEGRNFKFAKDPTTGYLYVADSGHHRLQIYGPDEQQYLALSSPSGTVPSPTGKPQRPNTLAEFAEYERAYPPGDPDSPWRFPNALAVDNARLYATDTHNHRIAVLYLDGSLDRIILTVPDRRPENSYPVRFSRWENRLFVINRGSGYLEGEVVSIDLATGDIRPFSNSERTINPLDVLARTADVLVADRESMNILRFTIDGAYRGHFGQPSLQAHLSATAVKAGMLRLLRTGSLVGMGLVLLLLLLQKRLDRKQAERSGMPDPHRPIEALQRFLGPRDSRRRAFLLTAIPCLGQAAAGRVLRALAFLPIIVYLLTLWGYSVAHLADTAVTSLSVVVLISIVTGLFWTAIVLDGMRLNEGHLEPARPLAARTIALLLAVPLLTACVGGGIQILWEMFRRLPHAPVEQLGSFIGDALLYWGRGSMYMVPYTAGAAIGRLVGWGGAAAVLFGLLSLRLQETTGKQVRATVSGFFCGMIAWLITATGPASWLGGAYYAPLSLGMLLGTAVFLQFWSDSRMTVFVIPAVLAGVWTGNMIHLLFRPALQFVHPGTSARATSISYEAYGLHLAVLIVLLARERRIGRRPRGAVS